MPHVATSTVAFQIADPGLVPEGLAWDPVNQRMLVGSVARRKIVALDDRGARDLVPATAGGLMSVYGLRVDPRRKVVWAASNADPGAVGFVEAERGAAALFEIGLDGAIRRRFHLPRDGTPHLLNDVAVAPDGTVYVTDTLAGAVWRLTVDGAGLEPFVAVGKLHRPNGICLTADGERLLVAHAYGIADVDPVSKEILPLRSPRGVSLGGIDGLYPTEHGLVAIQSGLGFPRVVRLGFGPAGDIARAEVLESKNPLFATPTTGALHHGAIYYVANSHLDARGADGRFGPVDELSEPLILRAGLGPEKRTAPP